MDSNETLHEFLSKRLFYPLLAASALAMALYGYETYIGPGWSGPRLHLNLTLAWIPYLAALGAVALHRRGIGGARLWAVLVIWFVFFPNGPYLVTDYIYLSKAPGDVWQRIVIFLSFSFCGLTLGFVSMFLVQSMINVRRGTRAGWIVVVVALALSGLGVFLGRFLRWNSWDLFTRPGAVLKDMSAHLGETTQGVRPILFSIVLSGLLFVMYWVLRRFRDVEEG